MGRYAALIGVLDGLRSEAKNTRFEGRYLPQSDQSEKVRAARSLAFIHLYLKVMYGLRDFLDRESYITDGSYDGGLDAYYIDRQKKQVVLIQSKFRHTERNFEEKEIEMEEILSMQIKRVISGEKYDHNGNAYSGKILGFQRRLEEIPDLGRYKFVVVIIANLKKFDSEQIRKLSDGFDAQVFDFEKTYNELLEPVLLGNLFQAGEISVSLDLSNKNSGAKVGYYVETEFFDCEITVVFVPIVEVGRLLREYQNSLLKYNPRSYLEFQGEKVNEKIRQSALREGINDFAMLNNGVTIVCDKSSVNEHSGRKHKAVMLIENPQIINGGQTAYTLSRIVDERGEDNLELMQGKEVLVKVIAVEAKEGRRNFSDEKIKLIERISLATNSQSVVTNADRESGDPILREIQKMLFQDFGILLEVKRGEYSDAIRNRYVRRRDVVSRSEFLRVFTASNNLLARAIRRKQSLEGLGIESGALSAMLRRYSVGKLAFEFFGGHSMRTRTHKSYISILPKVSGALEVAQIDGSAEDLHFGFVLVEQAWSGFLDYASERDARFVRRHVTADGRIKLGLSTGRSHYGKFTSFFREYLATISPELGEVGVEKWAD